MPPATSEGVRQFLSASRFAVVGASADPSKFGNKVLRWYLTRPEYKDAVVPVHPSTAEIEGVACAKSIADVLASSNEPLSVTSGVLASMAQALESVPAAERGRLLRGVWIQPGAECEECADWEHKVSSGGGRVQLLYGGPCLLRDGWMGESEHKGDDGASKL
ncbi:hypothetical protein RI367_005412 [Sorochytrium milnesiophthora]